MVFATFDETREIARSLNFSGKKEWHEWCRSGKRPKHIPARPDQTYSKSGWRGWGDWLGTGIISSADVIFRGFQSAREFARSLSFKGQKEWYAFCRSGNRPPDIPTNPHRTYANNGWQGYGDWLGTGNVRSGGNSYRSFPAARQFVRCLKIKSFRGWQDFINSPIKPKDIPINPEEYYCGRGWLDWSNWLGCDLSNDNSDDDEELFDTSRLVGLHANITRTDTDDELSSSSHDDGPVDSDDDRHNLHVGFAPVDCNETDGSHHLFLGENTHSSRIRALDKSSTVIDVSHHPLHLHHLHLSIQHSLPHDLAKSPAIAPSPLSRGFKRRGNVVNGVFSSASSHAIKPEIDPSPPEGGASEFFLYDAADDMCPAHDTLPPAKYSQAHQHGHIDKEIRSVTFGDGEVLGVNSALLSGTTDTSCLHHHSSLDPAIHDPAESCLFLSKNSNGDSADPLHVPSKHVEGAVDVGVDLLSPSIASPAFSAKVFACSDKGSQVKANTPVWLFEALTELSGSARSFEEAAVLPTCSSLMINRREDNQIINSKVDMNGIIASSVARSRVSFDLSTPPSPASAPLSKSSHDRRGKRGTIGNGETKDVKHLPSDALGMNGASSKRRKVMPIPNTPEMHAEVSTVTLVPLDIHR